MSNEQTNTDEEISLKEMRKKIEAKIEDSLPDAFKKRHESKEQDIAALVENMREVDEITAKRIIEAMLFASNRPIVMNEFKKVLRGYTPSKIEKQIKALQIEYEREGRSFEIKEVAQGYELTTIPEYFRWLNKVDVPQASKSVSRATLETLAILAYKQPATRSEIAELRGVDVGGVMTTLLEKNLVKIVGRKEVPGRPLLYGTTDLFLEHFGLKSLADLPRIHEIKEIVEAAIEKENFIEQEKAEKQAEEIRKKKAVDAEETADLERQRSEIQGKYQEIAGQIEDVAVLKEKALSAILSPQQIEEGVEGEAMAAVEEGVENPVRGEDDAGQKEPSLSDTARVEDALSEEQEETETSGDDALAFEEGMVNPADNDLSEECDIDEATIEKQESTPEEETFDDVAIHENSVDEETEHMTEMLEKTVVGGAAEEDVAHDEATIIKVDCEEEEK